LHGDRTGENARQDEHLPPVRLKIANQQQPVQTMRGIRGRHVGETPECALQIKWPMGEPTGSPVIAHKGGIRRIVEL
jgi:hypothetical protein